MHIVSCSGGKDSTATYLWAIDQFGNDGFHAVFADTGHEHPVTVNYIRNLAKMSGGPPIHIVKADFTERLFHKSIKPSGIPFLDLMLWKGRAPSTKAQFCTEHLKLAPIRAWIESKRNDWEETYMYTGIRRGESKRRSRKPIWEFNEYFDAYEIRPMIHLTIADVFALHKEHDVPPNPLYAFGMTRVGCFPCIHARKEELSLLPEWAWQKLEIWERQIGRSWFPAGLVPGVFIPTIEDVRKWSLTQHGGRVYDPQKVARLNLPEDEKDVPTCMATWGHCE